MLAALLAMALAAEPTMKLTSPHFDDGGPIPAEFTCQGADHNPELRIEGVPEGAKSLVLIVDDPDAPDPKAPKMTWVHWVLYDIPPDTSVIPKALSGPPDGAREGRNSWKRTGYGGPCPPIGRHRYFHKLYALDAALGDLGKPDKDRLLAAMEGHVLARAELVGTYQKQ